MPHTFQPPERRDGRRYRAWRARVLQDRPICEHCNAAPSTIVSHIVQPSLGAGLMDNRNVLALCQQCDRDFTRSNPPLRQRPTRR